MFPIELLISSRILKKLNGAKELIRGRGKIIKEKPKISNFGTLSPQGITVAQMKTEDCILLYLSLSPKKTF